MRFKSGAKPQTTGQFTPKVRGTKPEVEHEMPAQEHPISVQPVEPTDPRKTGSKPEQLKQSVEGDSAPGQRAAGSFTDKKRRAG